MDRRPLVIRRRRRAENGPVAATLTLEDVLLDLDPGWLTIDWTDVGPSTEVAP